jgi:predicted DNA-binding protein (UPF0251 family)
MPTSRISHVVQQLRSTVLLHEGAGRTDGQLLGCFLDQRDERAFAALVKRHGPMVWGVAHQTALQVRRTAARRRARERQVTEMPEPAVAEQDLWRDLQPLLDHELSRLTDKYRAVIVLCELEGKTRKEAARQLGVPEGTIASRMATARRRLAKRLSQRGIALSSGALAVMLSQKVASAGVPASVLSSTIKTAGLLAVGRVL